MDSSIRVINNSPSPRVAETNKIIYDQFNQSIESIKGILSDWQVLLENNCLDKRMDLTKFDRLSVLAKAYSMQGSKEHIQIATTIVQQEVGIKKSFEKLLLNSIQEVSNTYDVTKHVRVAEQLNKLATSIFETKKLSAPFREELQVAWRDLYSKMVEASMDSSYQTTLSSPFYIAKTISEFARSSWVDQDRITEAMVKKFIERGGVIQVLDSDKPILLNRNDLFIPCCKRGETGSQTMRALLLKNGCQHVTKPVSGGETGMNLAAQYCSFGLLNVIPDDGFTAALGMEKVPQLGYEELNDVAGFDVSKHHQWYQSYIDSLKTPAHFVCFRTSGATTLERLLQKQGDLKGFTVTFIPWEDEIQAPATESVESFSKEAYQAFYNKLEKSFLFN